MPSNPFCITVSLAAWLLNTEDGVYLQENRASHTSAWHDNFKTFTVLNSVFHLKSTVIFAASHWKHSTLWSVRRTWSSSSAISNSKRQLLLVPQHKKLANVQLNAQVLLPSSSHLVFPWIMFRIFFVFITALSTVSSNHLISGHLFGPCSVVKIFLYSMTVLSCGWFSLITINKPNNFLFGRTLHHQLLIHLLLPWSISLI